MENKYANSVDFFNAKPKTKHGDASNLILAAYELHTPENVGAMIRLAANLGIDKVIFIQSENNFKAKKIARVAHSSLKHVDFSFIPSADFYDSLPEEFEVVAVETSENATNLFVTSLPEKCVLLVGSERFGISQDFLNRTLKTVYIPMLGKTSPSTIFHLKNKQN